jgi:DNA polymerase III subunit delta
VKDRLYLITGNDVYAREATLKKYVAQFLEPEFASLNFEKYDQPTETGPVFDAWITPPFWGERRVIHAHLNAEAMAELAQTIDDHLSPDFAPDNVLLISAEGLDKRRKANKALLKIATHIECEEIKRWNAHKVLGPWLREQVEAVGWSIMPDAVDYLIDACGTDKHLLQSAVDKVLLYLDEPEALDAPAMPASMRTIRLEVVRQLVVQTESDIFLWLELIARRDHQAAFSHFHTLLLRENPNKILSTLGTSVARLYRTLFYQSQGRNQAEIAKMLGMNPYVVKMDLQRWQRFSLAKMTHSMQYLLDLQVRSRSSRLKPELALEMWLGDILSP